MQGSARDRLAHGRTIPGDIIAPQRRVGQSAQAGAQYGPPSGQYAFLLQAGISAATLAIAEAEARQCGVSVHQVLLCAGLVSPTAYTSALAGQLGVPVAGWDAVFHPGMPGGTDDVNMEGVPAHLSGLTHRVLCAEKETPDVLRERLAGLKARGSSVALSTRFRLDAALDAHLQPVRLDHAVSGLARQQPACSAAGPTWIWQVIAGAIAVGLLAGGFSVLPYATLVVVSGLIGLPFLCVTLLRVIALREVVASPRKAMRRQPPAAHILPQTLPHYTVMVPLFREVKVLPGLLQSLQAIVYPRAKLEILLVLEAADIETQAAVLGMRLPGNIRTVVVPDQAPRTKPKALNYALQLARGEYVVVYDAEDRPEPDQLLRALTAFERGPPELGCVQAQLNVYNPRASWLTRQFTIEYSALFDAVLPALARLGLPVPLGGTFVGARASPVLRSTGLSRPAG